MTIDSMIALRRKDLVNLGLKELLTPEDAVKFISENKNYPILIYVNSTCGCAAQTAIPALKTALKYDKIPLLATVFAGQDIEVTKKVREYLMPYAPSSPSFYILKDTKVVFAIERHQIWHKDISIVEKLLIDAFDKYC